jgi:hypothetical protein
MGQGAPMVIKGSKEHYQLMLETWVEAQKEKEAMQNAPKKTYTIESLITKFPRGIGQPTPVNLLVSSAKLQSRGEKSTIKHKVDNKNITINCILSGQKTKKGQLIKTTGNIKISGIIQNFEVKANNITISMNNCTIGKVADEKTPSTARTWTSGTHITEAEYEGMKNNQVQLKKLDGTIIKISLEKLSPADQDWIKKEQQSNGQ